MQYPGRVIKAGEGDGGIVKALKRELNKVLGSDPELMLDAKNPEFGVKMKRAVKLFQARNVDSEGRPLKQDGEVGALTWAALFGGDRVPVSEGSKDQLLARVLETAAGEEAKQVREVPRNSNRGPEVDAYLTRTGVPLGLSWCCAFVYWCFDESSIALARANPMLKTAGCLDHWNRSPSKRAKRIPTADAVQNPKMVKAGMIFIIDHGGGLGHTGLVEKVAGGMLTTIEGNTDASRTREGGGVYRLARKIGEINKGFIDYAGL
jgi:hypothetical protein